MDKRHLVLIDGYGFVFRAFHSLPMLTRGDGTVVNAVFGYIQMLMRLMSNAEYSHMAVVFDSGTKNFRHEIYSEYKAHRPPAPEELKMQFPLIRTATKACNIFCIEKSGFEADDVIATLAKKAEKENFKVTIVSSDKDLMQLVTNNVLMYDPLKQKIISDKEVKEKFGVEPSKVRDVLSLIGDSSDNVPGVKGIGPKGAMDLINTFGDLFNLLNNIDKITAKAQKAKLQENIDNAKLSYELVGLDEKVELDFTWDDVEQKPINYEDLKTFLEKNQFKKLLTRLDDICQNKFMVVEKKSINHNNFASQELNIETTSEFLNYAIKSLNLFIYQIDNSNLLLGLDDGKNITVEVEQLEEFKSILADEAVLKIGFNTKPILKLFEITTFEDLQLMAYLVDSGKSVENLSIVATNYLNIDRFENNPQNIIFTMKELYSALKEFLFESKLISLYEKLEKPLIQILANMEEEGIIIDEAEINKLKNEFNSKISTLEKEIFNITNCEFNVGSPKQLGEVLFEKMQLPNGKKGKSGSYSTDVEVMETLSWQGHDIADKVLNFRKYSKLVSTYTDSLLNLRDKYNKIHTTYSQTSTITGRLSSSQPNLQNIPIKTEDGQRIRYAFKASEGKVLISSDYSQIELRIIADMANVTELKDAFKHDLDIHKITASQVFSVPLDEVDDNLRRKAKAVNFGIIYGISGFGLAKQLKIARTDAKNIIEKYLETYHGIKKYMEDTQNFARNNGYVLTQFGRRCYTKDINNSNALSRSFAERLAINAPIQGTAADIIKKAMIDINKNLNIKLLLQVHDELIFEVEEEKAEEYARQIKGLMENTVNMSVPLVANISIGKSWGDL